MAGRVKKKNVLRVDLAEERMLTQVPLHGDHYVPLVVVPEVVREDARVADEEGRHDDGDRAGQPAIHAVRRLALTPACIPSDGVS